MSGPMYFNPTAAQVAASRASTCCLATPKDPTDCENVRTCSNKPASTGAHPACHNYRPRHLPRHQPHDEAECWPDNHGPLSNLPHDA